jgi:hypothetical protein
VPKWCLGQLLEELLAHPGKKDRNLIFIILLLEASIVEDHKLGNPG